MLSLFTNPIFKKFLSLFITIGIGFYIGYSLRNDQIKNLRKDKNFAKGQYQQLTASYQQLKEVTDTLQNTIIHLAVQERIQVDNYITDTKVKDGSQLNFVPKTRASLSVIKTKQTEVVPLITLPTTPTGQPTAPTPKKEEKKRNLLRRIFTRKKLK